MQDQDLASDSNPSHNNGSESTQTTSQTSNTNADTHSTSSSHALIPTKNPQTLSANDQKISNSEFATNATTTNSATKNNNASTSLKSQLHTLSSPNAQQNNKNKQRSRPSLIKISKNKVSIQTCCGILELTWMKVLAVLGMIVCAFSFFVLLALLIYGQNSSAKQDIAILVARSNLMLYQAWIDAYTLVAAYSRNASYMWYYYEYQDDVKNLTNYLYEVVPKDTYNVSEATRVTRNLEISNDIAAKLISNGNFTQAVSFLTSDRFLSERASYGELQDSLLLYVLNSQKQAIESSEIATLTSLIYLSVALAITLPSVVFILGFAINRDGIYQKRLQRARAIELQDTMNNPKLRALFKKHCMKELNQENFDFLEQVDVYKKLCEHLFELVHSEDDSSTNSGDTSLHSPPHGVTNQDHHSSIVLQVPNLPNTMTASSSLSGLETSKKRQQSFSSATDLGNEVELMEARKYTLVKDIYNTFLDVNGMKSLNITKSSADVIKNALEQYENKTIHSLSDTLFDKLERDISITLLDSHFRFKQSMDFLKEMKIKKIHDLKTNRNEKSLDQEKK
ncbi:hypothetical protein FDP41_008304 [Naegleria fowleri]|uniref:RGS domain-containing protein n=1 Tax=Naegleria fowleri TaxID=5763 RepID=A0A6A5BHU4_NAEFO|nr:uncharacterized protein FDP41_008304 [Naegleria fowleri]KAF0973600.1 hypothetical protein FDP41_008304 [Naegleria fowleri]CAG4717417.1 unnamed protein product [Naegleria fowleri]